MKSIYCPKCDKCVQTEVIAAVIPLKVRKADVVARQLKAVCPYCGDGIADEEMSRYNLDSAFDAYRESEGLLKATEIRDIYTQFGLTQSAFAKLLGLGAVTLSRYEHGSVQTKQIDGAIRSACEPSNMIALLESKGGLIAPEMAERALERAKELALANASLMHESEVQCGNFKISLVPGVPSEYNGFRSLDMNRAKNMVLYLVEKCENVGRTRLNKALFYSDFACFASTSRSMSGLAYARATYGPVVDEHDFLFGTLVREGVIEEELRDCGGFEMTVFRPNATFDGDAFTQEELDILNKVASFVNEFERASDLSNYSHREKLWLQNPNGTRLSYMDAFDLNEPERFIS